MTAETVNGTTEALGHSNGLAEFHNQNAAGGISGKKSKEIDRRRRRRKQKKANKASQAATNGSVTADDEAEDADEAKENNDPQQVLDGQIEVEYVPEKAEIEDDLLEDFKRVFEKFTFGDAAAGAEDDAKKDEAAANAAADKKANSDSDEEDQDTQQKEKGGLSNKKKKLQRRMKIAELKQICQRPDVVEIWDVTAADPKLLVYLKSYRNTVPVPRHWSQKRKFLQGTGYNNHGGDMSATGAT